MVKVASVAPTEKTPELPSIVGYKIRIKLKPDAVPTRILLRWLPLLFLLMFLKSYNGHN